MVLKRAYGGGGVGGGIVYEIGAVANTFCLCFNVGLLLLLRRSRRAERLILTLDRSREVTGTEVSHTTAAPTGRN